MGCGGVRSINEKAYGDCVLVSNPPASILRHRLLYNLFQGFGWHEEALLGDVGLPD